MGILEITILFVVIAVLLGIILIYNNCISARNKVSQSKSTIDVYLNQRFDLIPNLVQCVKGYQKHEENILKTISELRSIYNETLYNTTIQTFPNNIIANLFKMTPKELFTIEEYKAQTMEVKL